MSINEIPRATVPADVGAPDTIAFGLTFRQLAIIATVAVAGWAVYSTVGPLLPAVVWLIAAIPVAAVAVVVALGRRDGLPLDVWLRHAITFTRATRVATPGQARRSAIAALAGTPVLPAPLRFPATAISPTGVLTGEGGARVLIACGTTNVHLRTEAEQAGLLDGFGRLLNSLTRPAQIVVGAHRLDLVPYAKVVLDAAPRLGHAALRAAADEHAAFLLELDATRDPLRRQVVAVFTGEQSADTAVRALGGLGIRATTLDGAGVVAALAATVDPYASPVTGPRAVPGTPITSRRTS